MTNIYRGLDGKAHAAVIVGEECPIEHAELTRIVDACNIIAAEHKIALVAMPWGDWRDKAPVHPENYVVVIGIEVAHFECEAENDAAADWDRSTRFTGETLAASLDLAKARVPTLIKAIGAAVGIELEGNTESRCLLVAAGPKCVAWVDTPGQGQIGTVPDETPEIVGVEPGDFRLTIEVSSS
jgi:hypothetical protein